MFTRSVMRDNISIHSTLLPLLFGHDIQILPEWYRVGLQQDSSEFGK